MDLAHVTLSGNNPHCLPIDDSPLSAVIERLAGRGYAQGDLERVLGLSAGYLSKVRHGRVTASAQLDTLLRLVDEAPKPILASIARTRRIEAPSPHRVDHEQAAPQRLSTSAPPAEAKRERKGTRRAAPALLASIVPLMAQAQVRWALGGARALAAHGVARTTTDVDIFVAHDDRQLLRLLRDRGFALAFFSEDHVGCVPADATHPDDRLDLHFTTLSPLAEALLHPEHHTVFGVDMPVLAATALCTAKLMSLVPKDLLDAAALIGFDLVDRAELRRALTRLLRQERPTDPYARRFFDPQRALNTLDIDGNAS